MILVKDCRQPEEATMPAHRTLAVESTLNVGIASVVERTIAERTIAGSAL